MASLNLVWLKLYSVTFNITLTLSLMGPLPWLSKLNYYNCVSLTTIMETSYYFHDQVNCGWLCWCIFWFIKKKKKKTPLLTILDTECNIRIIVLFNQLPNIQRNSDYSLKKTKSWFWNWRIIWQYLEHHQLPLVFPIQVSFIYIAPIQNKSYLMTLPIGGHTNKLIYKTSRKSDKYLILFKQIFHNVKPNEIEF